MSALPAPGPALSPPALAPGKSCGACAMCCKLFAIPEVEKGTYQWCRHVVQGKGCGIHPDRPTVCREFYCHWLRNPNLGPDWRPDRAKFLIYIEMGGRRMVVAPDSGSPGAWRREPYYSQFKRWAAAGAASNHQILVFNGKRATAVLPDRDVDLGTVEVGDEIIYHAAGSRVEIEHTRKQPA